MDNNTRRIVVGQNGEVTNTSNNKNHKFVLCIYQGEGILVIDTAATKEEAETKVERRISKQSNTAIMIFERKGTYSAKVEIVKKED